MNIKLWFLENKTIAALVALFIVATAGLGYFAYIAWDDYGSATAEYSSKASELDTLSHQAIFPSASNLRKLIQTLSKDQANLDQLRQALQSYRIPSFGEIEKIKPQDQPQYFQDTLRAQVTTIKSLAASLGSTLPPTFYLGLDEYENRLPQPDQLFTLSKQLTVLKWLAANIVSNKGMIVADFTRLPDAAKSVALQKKSGTRSVSGENQNTTSALYDSLGSTRVTLRCSQGAFRELINAISVSPYFLMIEDIKVQNSVAEPPRRDTAPPATEQSSDGSTSIQRLPVVVGRESLNIFIKIRTIDFPIAQNQPGSSK